MNLLIKMGMCSLNNDPLAFKKNRDNIIASIQKCKSLKCTIRVGAELEVPGYSCGDHFNEYDTVLHSWECIRDIIESGVTNGIVCDLGMPVCHHGNIYNCRVIIYNGKVMGIRAKTILADGDNYYETRWFGFWKEKKAVDDFKLPRLIQDVTGQTSCPIGVFLIDFNDACLGYEICEQAWISDNPMIDAVMDGVEIMINPSASNVEKGKLSRKLQMLKELTQRHGGSYLYTNVKGCSGDRIYFDGGCIFTENGVIKGLSNLNTLQQIIVTPVVVNITDIRTFRLSNKSFLKSSNGVKTIPRVKIDINVANCEEKYVSRNEEYHHIAQLIREYEFPHARYEPSLFLWDYLRKSKAAGFFLPLSGGLDSCAAAITVYNMCCIVYTDIARENNLAALADLRTILKDSEYDPRSPEEICSKLLYTCYMKTNFSSAQTQKMAKQIAKQINSHHRSIQFHSIFESFKSLCSTSLGKQIDFTINGGTQRQDAALKNIQSRTRMLIAYLFAQTELEVPNREGVLLVLGTSNVDEELTGNFTKYGTSAADINPLGSFSRSRIIEYLKWADDLHKFNFINEIVVQRTKSELAPEQELELTLDEGSGLGLNYEQVQKLSKLRRLQKLGPVSMFETICQSEFNLNPTTIGQKIKVYFRLYGKHRHKMSVLTPSFHYYPENCDDNRLDLRPMFYETNWDYQFEIIDRKAKQIEESRKQKPAQKKQLDLTKQIKSLRAKYVKRASFVEEDAAKTEEKK